MRSNRTERTEVILVISRYNLLAGGVLRIGKEPVSKTGARKGLQVRVLSPPLLALVA